MNSLLQLVQQNKLEEHLETKTNEGDKTLKTCFLLVGYEKRSVNFSGFFII